MVMPEKSDSGAAAILPFGETLGGAFAIVFDQFWMFIKAMIVPLLLWIVLGIAAFLLTDVSLLLLLAVQFLAIVPLAILGVAYCRLALLGQAAGALPRPLFGRRIWVFCGYSLLFGIITAIPVLAMVLLAFGEQMLAGPGAIQDPAASARRGLGMFSVILLAALLLFYVLMRFSLVFPATAVDQKLGLRGSWRLTRGRNGWKLCAVVYVLYLICMNAVFLLMFMSVSIFGFFVTQPDALPQGPQDIDVIGVLVFTIPTLIVVTIAEGLVLALVISAIASAYARLSGQRPG